MISHIVRSGGTVLNDGRMRVEDDGGWLERDVIGEIVVKGSCVRRLP